MKTKVNPLKKVRNLIVLDDITDIEGWTIKAGTLIHIVDESLPRQPFGMKDKIIVCRIDNGTDWLGTMPEAFIMESKLKNHGKS